MHQFAAPSQHCLQLAAKGEAQLNGHSLWPRPYHTVVYTTHTMICNDFAGAVT